MTAIGQESEMDTQGVLPFAVDDPLLTAAEAAEVLGGVSRWWFGELVRRGRVGSGGGFWCGDRWWMATSRPALASLSPTPGTLSASGGILSIASSAFSRSRTSSYPRIETVARPARLQLADRTAQCTVR